MQIKTFTMSHFPVGASENAYFSGAPRIRLPRMMGKLAPLISLVTLVFKVMALAILMSYSVFLGLSHVHRMLHVIKLLFFSH